jgi:hypothetical protein
MFTNKVSVSGDNNLNGISLLLSTLFQTCTYSDIHLPWKMKFVDVWFGSYESALSLLPFKVTETLN